MVVLLFVIVSKHGDYHFAYIDHILPPDLSTHKTSEFHSISHLTLNDRKSQKVQRFLHRILTSKIHFLDQNLYLDRLF